MIWKAELYSGQILQEFDNGVETPFSEIDQTQLKVFGLYDIEKQLLHFDGASGKIGFQNLDLQKLEKLEGNEKLTISYNSEMQAFKMDPESLKLYNSLLLEQNKCNMIELYSTGIFNINGLPFKLEAEGNGHIFDFIDHQPFSLIHYKDAITDFISMQNSAKPYKRVDAVVKYTVGYKKIYTFAKHTFNLSLKIVYDVVQRVVSAFLYISCDQSFDGKLRFFFGDSQTEIKISASANELAKWEKILSNI